MSEPIAEKEKKFLNPSPERTIKSTKDWFNPINIRKVNKEYQKIKTKFNDASQTTKDTKNKWQDVKKLYLNYCNDIYDKDIDALLELSEICSQLGEFGHAIVCIEKSQELQHNNPSHLIRLGYNYARHKKEDKALIEFRALKKYFEEKHDPIEQHASLKSPKGSISTNKEYTKILMNCATSCILLLGNEGIHKSKTTRTKLLTDLKDYSKLLKQYATNEGDVNDIVTSLKRLERGDLALKNTHKIKGPKGLANRKGIGDRGKESGEGAEPNHRMAEQRTGVNIILYLFSSASKNQIKEQWLYNSATNKRILDELTYTGFIEELKEIDGNTRYRNTEDGNQHALKYLYIIFKSLDSKKLSGILGIITEALVEKVEDWEQISPKKRVGIYKEVKEKFDFKDTDKWV